MIIADMEVSVRELVLDQGAKSDLQQDTISMMPMVTPTATPIVDACGACNLHRGRPCCPHLVIYGCMH